MTPSSIDPAALSRAFSLPTRVYWEDTDAGGVVYHAQYLAFLERARTEWMRAQGHGQETLRLEHDLVFAVRAMRIDFRKPARLDDALLATVSLRQCRDRSTWATCPVACTPASVRPAPATCTSSPQKRLNACASAPCTVSWSAWICQPA